MPAASERRAFAAERRASDASVWVSSQGTIGVLSPGRLRWTWLLISPGRSEAFSSLIAVNPGQILQLPHRPHGLDDAVIDDDGFAFSGVAPGTVDRASPAAGADA